LQGRVNALKGQVLDLRGRNVRYRILQREVDTKRSLYDALLGRYKEIGVAGGIGTSAITFVDRVEPAATPFKPNLPRDLLAGLALGLLDGLGAAVGRLVIALGAVAVILLGIILIGSMAGLALLLPVGLATLAVALPVSSRAAKLLTGAGLLLLVGALIMLAAFTDAGSNATSVATRSDIYHITLQAIRDTFPAGTGLGTFQAYYRLYENPSLVDSFFVNHAHSDPLEWVLETGLPGLLLIGAFLLWWATRVVRLWRAERPDLIALAATITSGAILAHSVVDYPLRDAAIQAVFAVSLAFMAEPRSHGGGRRSRSDGQERAPRHMTLDDHGSFSGWAGSPPCAPVR